MDAKPGARSATIVAPVRLGALPISVLLSLLWLVSLTVHGDSGMPLLASDTEIATAGYYRLSWQGETSAVEYELQASSNADFSTPRLIYRGPDLATVISGQADGDYFYRLRARQAGERTGGRSGAWSAPVKVHVQHHSLARALAFFAAGALVFIATLLLVLRGARD